MNENIIQNFRNLILFYQNNINDDPKTKKTIGFKIRNFRKVVLILESYDKKIEAGTELVNVKGIGEGTINRINQISTRRMHQYPKLKMLGSDCQN